MASTDHLAERDVNGNERSPRSSQNCLGKTCLATAILARISRLTWDALFGLFIYWLQSSPRSPFSKVLNHLMFCRSSKVRQELPASLDQLLAPRHQAWKFFIRRRKAYRRSSCLVRQPVKLLSEPAEVYLSVMQIRSI